MISIIVAISDNNAIGSRNAMPWHISEDFIRFKAITLGHAVVMGRKTFESIGRPLPARRNIVITRDRTLRIEGCETVGSLEEAVVLCPPDDEVFVIGGGEIYRQALPLAQRLYITRVHITVDDADTFFPAIGGEWREVFREERASGKEFPHAFTFVDYERK